MGKIVKIENEAIKKSLESTTRQYFVGNLSKPQEIKFVRDERLEIGVSSYPDYKYEPTHVHDIPLLGISLRFCILPCGFPSPCSQLCT